MRLELKLELKKKFQIEKENKVQMKLGKRKLEKLRKKGHIYDRDVNSRSKRRNVKKN